MPNSFAESGDGLLLVASGFDPVMRWDGITTQMELAGMAPPATAPTIGHAGTGTLTGTYRAYVRYVDDRDQVSNLSPVSAEVTVTAAGEIDYTNVPVPTDPKVVRRQILRNTDGQEATFFVDVDTEDLVSTSFRSTLDDTTLGTQEAQAILDSQGNILANLHDAPPAHKAALASHLGRMFLGVEFDYTQGCVVLTNSSTQVQGVGTEWTGSLAGRTLYVTDARASYDIAAVDVPNQVLTLTRAYTDATDPFGVYAIRPAPAERKLVYYSEAALPESWPPSNSLHVPDDGDELTGMMVKGSFLYFVERRHTYRFTFQTDPAKDGFMFLASERGCVNARCWVLVDESAYMLDEQGIHLFGGQGSSEPVSTPVQEMFRFSDAPLRLNWSTAAWWHAAHYPQQEVIRWFVALSGDRLPRHALAYNYRAKRWWVEEYNAPIGASCTGLLAGQPQVYLGADSRRVLALWQGTLDGPDPSQGTVRGTAGTITPDSLTDPAAAYAAAGLVGNPVYIVDGTGRGQARVVRAVSGQTVQLTWPWSVTPDATSVYQLGAIQWRFQSGWFRFTAPSPESMVERRVAVVFQPCRQPAGMVLRLLLDFATAPYQWGATIPPLDANGVGTTKGSADVTWDLSRAKGFAALRLPGSREFFVDGGRFLALQFVGWTNTDWQRVYLVQIDGVGQQRV